MTETECGDLKAVAIFLGLQFTYRSAAVSFVSGTVVEEILVLPERISHSAKMLYHAKRTLGSSCHYNKLRLIRNFVKAMRTNDSIRPT